MTRNKLRHPSPLDPRRELPAGLRWYVLTTEPKREFHVAHWLKDQGLFSLVPLVYKLQTANRHGARRNLKRGKIEMPLIPRVVVVGFETAPQLHVLAEDCWYITGILGIDGEPIPMRQGEAERLRLTSAELLRPKPDLRPGDRAKLTRLGFRDEYLDVVEIKSLNGKHAKIIQSWFGAEREVTVAVEDLEAAA